MYQSTEMRLDLDPENVFGIVGEIARYCSNETSRLFPDNSRSENPVMYMLGIGRRMEIFAESALGRHENLADLVLDSDELTLLMHAHSGILPDPEGLIQSVRRYELRDAAKPI
jgi:hypothetical protein